MGLKSERPAIGVTLGIGVTIARFQDDGGLPWLRDRLVMCVTMDASS